MARGRQINDEMGNVGDDQDEGSANGVAGPQVDDVPEARYHDLPDRGNQMP